MSAVPRPVQRIYPLVAGKSELCPCCENLWPRFVGLNCACDGKGTVLRPKRRSSR